MEQVNNIFQQLRKEQGQKDELLEKEFCNTGDEVNGIQFHPTDEVISNQQYFSEYDEMFYDDMHDRLSDLK